MHIINICTTPVMSISFSASDIWIAISAAEHVYFVWREHPTGQDILSLWLNPSRSVENCTHITRELLAIYPNLVNLKVQKIYSARVI